METKEKQKKGFMSMSIYKYTNPKKKHHHHNNNNNNNNHHTPPESDTTPTTKNIIVSNNNNNNWGVLRKSKTYREPTAAAAATAVAHGGQKVVVVEARRSVSHVETTSNLSSIVAFLQVRVLVTDMPGFMQVHAFKCARTTYDSLEKFSSKHLAYNLKKEFDKVYGPAWHCIVGSSFGSYVTHSTSCFLYFSMEKFHILIFKTKVQKASD